MVPAFSKVPGASVTNEIIDCKRRLTAEGMGVITINDVYALAKHYRYTARYIEFHTPAEH